MRMKLRNDSPSIQCRYGDWWLTFFEKDGLSCKSEWYVQTTNRYFILHIKLRVMGMNEAKSPGQATTGSGIKTRPPAKVSEAMSKALSPILKLPTLANFAHASINAQGSAHLNPNPRPRRLRFAQIAKGPPRAAQTSWPSIRLRCRTKASSSPTTTLVALRRRFSSLFHDVTHCSWQGISSLIRGCFLHSRPRPKAVGSAEL